MPAVKGTDHFDIDIYDQIRDVVERAMRGAKKGSRKLLRGAFHEKAQMFGEVMGTRYDEGIESFFDLCEEHPLGKGGLYRSRIVSISRAGNAAMVMVAEDGCWGSASFVDFFTVTRIERDWKITNKTFAYTGGRIPPEVVGRPEEGAGDAAPQ
jgi:hypothetical protein